MITKKQLDKSKSSIEMFSKLMTTGQLSADTLIWDFNKIKIEMSLILKTKAPTKDIMVDWFDSLSENKQKHIVKSLLELADTYMKKPLISKVKQHVQTSQPFVKSSKNIIGYMITTTITN
jgi:hypothetical protein